MMGIQRILAQLHGLRYGCIESGREPLPDLGMDLGTDSRTIASTLTQLLQPQHGCRLHQSYHSCMDYPGIVAYTLTLLHQTQHGSSHGPWHEPRHIPWYDCIDTTRLHQLQYGDIDPSTAAGCINPAPVVWTPLARLYGLRHGCIKPCMHKAPRGSRPGPRHRPCYNSTPARWHWQPNTITLIPARL